jgi:tetratricopeptide (TPR) repeat protein
VTNSGAYPSSRLLKRSISSCSSAPAPPSPPGLVLSAARLIRLLPALAAHVADATPLVSSSVEVGRHRLFAAVAGWLRAATTDRPILLVIEDAHWASKQTVLLLRHMIGALGTARILIAITYRDTGLSTDHPLCELLAEDTSASGLLRLPLSGLDAGDARLFLQGALGRQLDDADRALASVVHARSAGNPLFMTEMIRHLRESGTLQDIRGPTTDAPAVAAHAIPGSLRAVISRRLALLSPAARQMLSVAAAIGPTFRFALLGSVIALSEDRLPAVLAESIGARLVEETGTYEFTHSVVRDVLYQQLGTKRQAHLHLRIAQALEEMGVGPSRQGELAFHYARAGEVGEPRRALEHIVRAGDQAAAALAHDEAAAYYHQAVDLLAGMPGTADERCELLIKVGEARRDAGDPRYREPLQAATRLARENGNATLLAHAALANTRGFASSLGAVDAERVAALEAALAAHVGGSAATRARLLAALGSELVFSGDRARVSALADEALALARQLGDLQTMAYVFHHRYLIGSTPDTLGDRLTASAQHLALAQRLGDPYELFWAAVRRCEAALEAGEVAALEGALTSCAQTAEELGLPILRWSVARQRAQQALTAGRVAEAEQLAAEGFEIARASGQPDAAVLYQYQLAGIRRVQGRHEELVPLVQWLLSKFPDTPTYRAQLAEVYCQLGRRDAAWSLIEREVSHGFANVPYDASWLTALVHFARVLAPLGAPQATSVLHERLAPWHDHVEGVGGVVNGSVSLYLGMLATSLGRFDAAEAHFHEAATQHHRLGAPYLLACTRLEWARMLLRRNSKRARDRASALVNQVQTEARQWGFAGLERNALSLRRVRAAS